MVLGYYFFKVLVCSGLLYGYYFAFLRNKQFHQFNRVYLLFIVVFALGIPVMRFNISSLHSEEAGNPIHLLQIVQSSNFHLEEGSLSGRHPISLEFICRLGYFLISSVFFGLFLNSLVRFYRIIKSANPIKIKGFRIIPTDLDAAPFTFFNYVFWKRQIDLNSPMGQQILNHELVHARQIHSADTCLLHFVISLFWLNPFFWLIRRELKLVHEFIADTQCLTENGSVTLASMILHTAYNGQFQGLANHFFQTPIKRRLIMLSKIHPRTLISFGRLLIIPVLIIAALAFSVPATINLKSKLNKKITVVIDAGHGKTSPGVVVDQIKESDLTLSMARKINQLNGDDKINILLSRSSEEIVSLKDRVKYASDNRADLFISLHINAASSQALNTSGIEVFIPKNTGVFNAASEKFGSSIVYQLSTAYKTNPSLQINPVGIWVLDAMPCPAVLIECGYLTDPTDRKFLLKEDNQIILANKILKAIEAYALDQGLFKPEVFENHK